MMRQARICFGNFVCRKQGGIGPFDSFPFTQKIPTLVCFAFGVPAAANTPRKPVKGGKLYRQCQTTLTRMLSHKSQNAGVHRLYP
jgi:hypothetical protein